MPPRVSDRHRIQAEQAAAFLDLTLDPAQLDGVATQLAVLEGHAALIMALPLPTEAEPAPVFIP